MHEAMQMFLFSDKMAPWPGLLSFLQLSPSDITRVKENMYI